MSEHQRSLQSPFVPGKSDQIPLWKSAYERAVRESDAKKLLTEIHATEEALFHRWQEIGDDVAHAKERIEMEAASEDLLAIKIHRLGWPDPCR
jgi:hypothetical protein